MKIVIVGGGTAGWIAACYYARFNQSSQNEITVIESSKIPIIGAGEGSTGIFTKIVNSHFSQMGINEIDFLNKTKSTLKLGIRFKDWNGEGTEFLSPVQPTETTISSVDTHVLISHILGDYADSSPSGYLMNNNLSTYSKSGTTIMGHSYHFDAKKVGEYFKEYAMKAGVKCVDTEVTSLNINKDNGELDSVETTIGNISADFWVDCSGFARVLIGPMGGGWKSYEEYLPTNSAIPYIHQYENGESPKLETLAWAMPNGWMWQIPTQERYGCGYVYSDKFTTYDNAVDELIKTTGRKIEPLRNLKFDVGRVETPWVKNVVAIGLAQGFVEPLEATSIHATIIQLDFLLTNSLNFFSTKESTIFDANVNRYNDFVAKFFDDIKDLIQLHYMTEREDTPFWKYCKYEMKRTDNVKDILEICKYRSPSMLDFKFYHGSGNWGVWCWSLIGLGHLTKDVAKHTLKAYNHTDEQMQNTYKAIKSRNFANSIRCMNNVEFMKALLNKSLGK
jgi:tryptophan halogenase